jgi:hypothetical protein
MEKLKRNTKYWNKELTEADVIKEEIYVDFTSPDESKPCCVKLITDRISHFIEAHRVIYPESQENKWDLSNPNCTLLKITQGVKKSLVISFYANNGTMMAQGKETSMNDWILLVENMKESKEIKKQTEQP